MTRPDLKTALLSLRDYAISQGVKARLSLHREDSHLVRLANGNVSLNTTEHIVSLRVTAFDGNRNATCERILDLSDEAALRAALDQARAMLPHTSPLSYTPTFPVIAEDSHFDADFDAGLAYISNGDILAYINAVADGLEDGDVTLGGSFSVGSTEEITLSTATTHAMSYRISDAQITLVLASEQDKWEINAEQSAQRLSDLDPQALHARLQYLKDKYINCEAVRLPLGPCRVVFGPAATAEYLSFLTRLGLYGWSVKWRRSIHQQEDVGKAVLSPLVTVTEGPDNRGAFPLPTDSFGRSRQQQAWYEAGVLKGFLYDQATADEFGETATGHDLAASFALAPGDREETDMADLQALAAQEGDILYVPYLHYTGVVNASQGLITGTSRFGALLFKQDGEILVPYNVRFTEKLSDIFGAKLQWLSREQTVYNQSHTYGERSPSAVVVPKLMCCDGVKVEISNSSY